MNSVLHEISIEVTILAEIVKLNILSFILVKWRVVCTSLSVHKPNIIIFTSYAAQLGAPACHANFAYAGK